MSGTPPSARTQHYLALPCLAFALSYPTLPYLTLPYLTLPYLTLPCLALPCLALLNLIPYLIPHVIPYLIPYLTLPFRTFPSSPPTCLCDDVGDDVMTTTMIMMAMVAAGRFAERCAAVPLVVRDRSRGIRRGMLRHF